MRVSRRLASLLGLAAFHAHAASWQETGVSPPDIAGNEGYAWDGSHNVIISEARIDRRADDAAWSLELSNTAPFRGLPGAPNHLGGGQAYGRFLYIPAETYKSCDAGQFGDMALAIYSNTTLQLVRAAPLTAQNTEVSAVAIAPDRGADGTIYVSSYCDGTALHLYDLQTLAYRGRVALGTPIPFIQGMTYKDGTLFVAGSPPGTVSDPDRTTLYTVNPDTGLVHAVYDSPDRGETEGLQWKGRKLILWINVLNDRRRSRAHILELR